MLSYLIFMWYMYDNWCYHDINDHACIASHMHDTTQHNTTQYNTTQQHNTIQHNNNTIQHNTIQHNNITQYNTTTTQYSTTKSGRQFLSKQKWADTHVLYIHTHTTHNLAIFLASILQSISPNPCYCTCVVSLRHKHNQCPAQYVGGKKGKKWCTCVCTLMYIVAMWCTCT